MRVYLSLISILAFMVFAFASCKNGDPDPPILTVTMNPDEAGTVVPDGGTYDYEENISVEAIPSGNWQFENWSGDVSSTENPLTITMDKDYTITANFTNDPDPPSTYSVEIPITDGVHSQTVTLVSDDDGSAYDGFDSNDREGPPIAPPGAFFTGSVVDGMHLYKDVRQAAGNIVWELRLNRASGETITLEDWSISKTDIGGSLMLVDDPNDPTPNIELDMQSASSFSVSDPSIQRLYIVYEQDASSKVITDMPTMGKELEIQEKTDPSVDRLKEGLRNTNEPNQLQQRNQ